MKNWNAMLVALAMVACSEAKSDGEGGGGAGDGAAPGDGGSGAAPGDGGSGATGASSADGGSTSSGTSDVVINEISATEDWVELYNTGDAAFDLGGIILADAESPGVPKLDEAISFPAGTSLAAGGFLFVLAKQETILPGEQPPQTECAPGSSPCFYAPFGLSDGDGDELFLVDGDRVISSAEYPPAGAVEPQSWCRQPDGGAFAVCDASPGTSNAP